MLHLLVSVCLVSGGKPAKLGSRWQRSTIVRGSAGGEPATVRYQLGVRQLLPGCADERIGRRGAPPHGARERPERAPRAPARRALLQHAAHTPQARLHLLRPTPFEERGTRCASCVCFENTLYSRFFSCMRLLFRFIQSMILGTMYIVQYNAVYWLRVY